MEIRPLTVDLNMDQIVKNKECKSPRWQGKPFDKALARVRMIVQLVC